jgi:hypothetical protein
MLDSENQFQRFWIGPMQRKRPADIGRTGGYIKPPGTSGLLAFR